MKITLQLDKEEMLRVFGKNTPPIERAFQVIINDNKFEGIIESVSIDSFKSGYLKTSFNHIIHAECVDKKAQEITQAKAEVNRTKEAHKEAQRKLNALMEETNGDQRTVPISA